MPNTDLTEATGKRPAYQSPYYNFFAPGFELDMVVLQHFGREGFNCELRGMERKEPKHGKSAYLKSSRKSSSHFWLRISNVYLVPMSRTMSVRVEIGDVDVVSKVDTRGLQLNPLYPREGAPDNIAPSTTFGFMSDSCLDAEWDYDLKEAHYFPAFDSMEHRPAEFRECIAKGVFWLGAPLDFAIQITGAELTEHQCLEWQLQRRDFCADFFLRFEPRRRYVREDKQLLTHF